MFRLASGFVCRCASLRTKPLLQRAEVLSTHSGITNISRTCCNEWARTIINTAPGPFILLQDGRVVWVLLKLMATVSSLQIRFYRPSFKAHPKVAHSFEKCSCAKFSLQPLHATYRDQLQFQHDLHRDPGEARDLLPENSDC